MERFRAPIIIRVSGGNSSSGTNFLKTPNNFLTRVLAPDGHFYIWDIRAYSDPSNQIIIECETRLCFL